MAQLDKTNFEEFGDLIDYITDVPKQIKKLKNLKEFWNNAYTEKKLLKLN